MIRRLTGRRGDALLLGLAVGLLGCEAPSEFQFVPPEGLDELYMSSTLQVSAEYGSEELCAGSMPAIERTLVHFGSFTGLGLAPEAVQVYWVSPPLAEELCGFPSSACNPDDGVAVTPYLPVEHELAHTYLDVHMGNGPRFPFFEEGFAVALGREGAHGMPKTTLEEATSDPWTQRLGQKHYARAGHFVDFMFREFEPEAVMDFYAGISGESRWSSMKKTFSRVFGEDYETFAERYEAEAPECGRVAWSRAAECLATPLPWKSETQWSFETDLRCEADGVSGGVGRDNIWTTATLEVETQGKYNLNVLWPDGFDTSVLLQRCGPCEQAIRTNSNDLIGTSVELEPGTYYVFVERPLDNPASRVVVTLSR